METNCLVFTMHAKALEKKKFKLNVIIRSKLSSSFSFQSPILLLTHPTFSIISLFVLLSLLIPFSIISYASFSFPLAPRLISHFLYPFIHFSLSYSSNFSSVPSFSFTSSSFIFSIFILLSFLSSLVQVLSSGDSKGARSLITDANVENLFYLIVKNYIAIKYISSNLG